MARRKTDMTPVLIEKDIPIPSKTTGPGAAKSPKTQAMLSMGVGESFKVGAYPSNIYSLKPRKFVVRKVDDGLRVWRVA